MPFLKTKCPNCQKVAESTSEFSIDGQTIHLLKCGHLLSSIQYEKRSAANVTSLDGKVPYKFQVDTSEFLESAGGRALVAHEMGLGKTICTQVFLATHPELNPTLYIVKSTLKIQWLREIIRWQGAENVAQIVEDARSQLIPGFKSYIISFDLIRRFGPQKGKKVDKMSDEEFDEYMRKSADGVQEQPKNDLRSQMKLCGIKTIIIDECQQIKNPTSQRTASVRALTEGIENIICLSGTPIKNNAAEYFPVLNILHPEMFPQYNKFVYNYCDAYKSGFGWKVGGLKDPKGFLEKTKSFIIRKERKEVLPDLPSIQRNFSFHELSKEVEKAYEATFKQFQQEYDSGGAGQSAIEKEANILAYLSKMRHLTGLSKIDPAIDFTIEFLGSTDRKLTIFVHHKDVASILHSKLSSLCAELELVAPLTLTSDLSNEARANVVERFMMDGPESPRILIASTLASGEGLNLQKCSDCIMLERQWNPANEEQAEGRFIRIGQLAEAVTATYFVAVGTVDEFFAEIVERKREIVSSTLSGQASKWDQSSLMKELAEVLASKGGKRWGL